MAKRDIAEFERTRSLGAKRTKDKSERELPAPKKKVAKRKKAS